jgi:hypothetical protein
MSGDTPRRRIDEAQLARNLPFVIDLQPEQRGAVLAGMNALLQQIEGWSETDPELNIGVILIFDDSFETHIVPRANCLLSAVEIGLGSEHLLAIASPPDSGHFDVLLVGDSYELVFGLPIAITRVPRPGSENN